ncbi:hypothetical protein [Pseudoroseicyclus sp. CXY001]|uniref:hypothetical protein n=1 Tax=Pseudoroseicyclus sp. CXY001 TaxID=3242492 RepID=UPI00358DAFD9
MLRNATLAALMLAAAGPAAAAGLEPVMTLCSDPMTTGPQKLERLPAIGWQQLAEPDGDKLLDLATAHVMGFTQGMDDLEARFALASELAGNFASVMAGGTITLWTQGEAVLAFAVAETPEGLEHVSCYYAAPPDDELFALSAAYGAPEELPDLELRALRFDETALAFNPDRVYQMISTWTRLTSDPPRTELTDAYRLERVQQPAE